MLQVLNISIILVCFLVHNKKVETIESFLSESFPKSENKKLVVQLDPPVFGQVNLGQ